MKVRVLGCSGAIAKGCRTTSFLIDDDVLIDAGTGVGDLSLAEMRKIDHVFLTHSHLDHVAALPLMIDAVASQRHTPLKVHALEATIAALKTHVFNNVIWPDFSRIPSERTPLLTFEPLAPGGTVQLRDRSIEALPAVHTVPAVGYAVNSTTSGGCWVFSGDTCGDAAFWARVNELPVRMLVIETAFSNEEQQLAEISRPPVAAPTGWPARFDRRRQRRVSDLHHAHQAGPDRDDHDRDRRSEQPAGVRHNDGGGARHPVAGGGAGVRVVTNVCGSAPHGVVRQRQRQRQRPWSGGCIIRLTT